MPVESALGSPLTARAENLLFSSLAMMATQTLNDQGIGIGFGKSSWSSCIRSEICTYKLSSNFFLRPSLQCPRSKPEMRCRMFFLGSREAERVVKYPWKSLPFAGTSGRSTSSSCSQVMRASHVPPANVLMTCSGRSLHAGFL